MHLPQGFFKICGVLTLKTQKVANLHLLKKLLTGGFYSLNFFTVYNENTSFCTMNTFLISGLESIRNLSFRFY
jgi:hypothetical protein